MTDKQYGMEGERGITELHVRRLCTTHDDENVNTAVAGFSWIRSRCVLRACLNEGVVFMENLFSLTKILPNFVRTFSLPLPWVVNVHTPVAHEIPGCLCYTRVLMCLVIRLHEERMLETAAWSLKT